MIGEAMQSLAAPPYVDANVAYPYAAPHAVPVYGAMKGATYYNPRNAPYFSGKGKGKGDKGGKGAGGYVRKCYNCGKPGHEAKDCRAPPKQR